VTTPTGNNPTGNNPTPYIIGGLGFVGGAMARAFVDSRVIDIAEPSTLKLYDEMVHGDVAFICVPTPFVGARGVYDYSAVRDALWHVPDGVITCLRSTVLYGSGLKADLVHPEFLRAASADEDFRSAKVRVYGIANGSREHVNVIERMYAKAGIVAATIIVSAVEACLLKLYHNAWCAVNVSLANEFAAHYEDSTMESWNGGFREHLLHLLEVNGKDFRAFSRVPGPDGKPGFGGACFPKDLSALRDCLRVQNVIEGALRTNARVRLPE